MIAAVADFESRPPVCSLFPLHSLVCFSYIADQTPVERPPEPLQFKLQHQPMTLSAQGNNANYLPPGHFLSERHTTYGSTGQGSDETLDGAYGAWKASQNGANPETAPKWATKVERR